MNSSIPVLYLITELEIGGSQAVLYRLLTRLDRSRFSPQVICLYNGEGTIAHKIRALGIPVFDMNMQKKTDLLALYRLRQAILDIRPTILHGSLFHTNILSRFLGWVAKVPIVICTEQTMAMEPEWRYRLNRFTLGLVNQVIANSVNVKTFYHTHVGVPAEKIQVIYDGIELPPQNYGDRTQIRQTWNLPAEAFVMVTLGRIDPVKGLDYLIRALPQLHQVYLMVIGEGPQKSRLQQLAIQHQVDDRIVWAGYQPDAFQLLSACDLFVQPSLFEGLPNSVLEAMAMQLPVVATHVGGIPEIIQSEKTGWLVPPKDTPALVTAIEHLQHNPTRRLELGRAGAARVRKTFTVEKMVNQYEQMYQSLIDQKFIELT